MSLIDELLEYTDEDKKIVKSFKTKDSLSNDIWEVSKKDTLMRDDVRKKLLEIADNFIESLGVEFFIHDIILTGSLSNYNWSKYSDVDLHIVIDFNEIGDNLNTDITQKVFKEFFDAKKNVWNETHDIKIKGYDVEIYVQDLNEKHESTGIYSVLNNKWLTKPTGEVHKIDEDKVLKKGEDYAKLIDSLSNKVKLGNDVTDEINKLKEKIKKFRQSGLEKGGEYSYENLTFKLLRRNGYIGKLMDLKTELTDKKLSITQ